MFFAEFVQLLHKFVLNEKAIRPYTKDILDHSFPNGELGDLSDSYLYRAYTGKKDKNGSVIGDHICTLMRDISYKYDKGNFQEFILLNTNHLDCKSKLELCECFKAEKAEIGPDNYAEIIAALLGEIYKEAGREPRSRNKDTEKREYEPKQLKAFWLESLQNDTDIQKAVLDITKKQIIDERKKSISAAQNIHQDLIQDINEGKILASLFGNNSTYYHDLSYSIDSDLDLGTIHCVKK